MNNVMAERFLIFISPDGNEISSSIQFGIPFESENHGYICEFEVPKIIKSTQGAGVDGVQAIIISMRNAKSLLEYRNSKGWKYLWADTREETTPNEIFQGLE